MPRIYLAGPDVFRPDADEHFRTLTRMCDALGLEALIPSDDGAAAAGLRGEALARAIYTTNMGLLTEADGVIANLAPFRGAEPDSGTVFEVGAAVALGLPVVVYGVSGAYADQVRKLGPVTREQGILRDAQGMAVEDFGLPLNLMLVSAVQVAATSEDALKVLAARLQR